MFLMRRIFHRHEWVKGEDALGILPKQNTPYPTSLPGYEEHCQCGARRFQAHVRGSHPVDIVE